MPKPTFVVAGAQKSATTWLHECLHEHPEVFVPDMKEVHFFCPAECGKSRSELGIEWYEGVFPSCGYRAWGETSVDYMYYPNIANALAEYNSELKVIFLLRNPVERAYSAYWMERRYKQDMPGFDSFIDAGHPYIQRGMYHRQLVRYLAAFPREQLLILFYDDVIEDPEAVLRRVYGFLGVDEAFMPRTVHERVASSRDLGSVLGVVVYRWFAPLAKVRFFLEVWRWLKRHTRVKQLLYGSSGKHGYTAMDEAVRNRLVELYRPENERLFALVGRELRGWNA